MLERNTYSSRWTNFSGKTSMAKSLVLVGGGHAHLTSISRMRELTAGRHRVTLVSPSPEHAYSGMGPGVLGGFYSIEEIRFPIKRMVEGGGGLFLEDLVTEVDPRRRLLGLASGREIPFDVVSFNVGSAVNPSLVKDPLSPVYPVKPVENLHRARNRIIELAKEKKKIGILVVGGGAAGLEVAGNAWRLLKEQTREGKITLAAGGRLLSSHGGRVREEALVSLGQRNIQVIEGQRIVRIQGLKGELEDGSFLPFDVCFLATGVEPPPLFRKGGLPVGDDGGLLVNQYLESVSHPHTFGGGDCISYAPRFLDKVGVHAVRQNPVLHHNLMAALESRSLRPFIPQKHYMLIFNLGDGKGLLTRKSWVWQGRLAFLLKDFIDRRFMKRFAGASRRMGGMP